MTDEEVRSEPRFKGGYNLEAGQEIFRMEGVEYTLKKEC